jgi:hypothetical protein
VAHLIVMALLIYFGYQESDVAWKIIFFGCASMVFISYVADQIECIRLVREEMPSNSTTPLLQSEMV